MLRQRTIEGHFEMGDITHFYESGSFEVDGIVYHPPMPLGINQPMLSLKDDRYHIYQGESVRRPDWASDAPIQTINESNRLASV